MHRRMLLMTTILSTLAVAGCLGGEDATVSSPMATAASEAPLTAIDWSLALDGGLAASFTVHPLSASTTDCNLRLDYVDRSPNGAHWTALVVGDERPHPTWVVVGSKGHVVQAHVPGSADTRQIVPQLGENQRIELAWTAEAVPAGARYTFAVTGLEAEGPDKPNVHLKASCKDATLQNVSAGRTAHLFDASTLHEGASLTVDAGLPGAGAAASVLDQRGASVQEGSGRVFVFGLYALAAQVDVEHPSGTSHWQHLPSLAEAPFWSLDDGAGAYHVMWSQVAWDGDDLVGAVVGLDPFTDLDTLRAAAGHGHDCDHGREEAAAPPTC